MEVALTLSLLGIEIVAKNIDSIRMGERKEIISPDHDLLLGKPHFVGNSNQADRFLLSRVLFFIFYFNVGFSKELYNHTKKIIGIEYTHLPKLVP